MKLHEIVYDVSNGNEPMAAFHGHTACSPVQVGFVHLKLLYVEGLICLLEQ